MKLFFVIAAAILLVALLGGGLWLWTPDRPRAALEAVYLRAPGDMVDAGGARLHVRDSGPREAAAIVMLHGFGSSLHTWESWAKALEGEFRVLRIDLPGSGLSPPDPTGRYDDARTMEVLIALLDRLGIARSGFVGNSIGGRIAWTFAALHPERVTRVVLVAPDGFASPGFAYGRAPDVPAMMGLMRYALPKALLRMNLVPSYADASRLTDDTVTRYHDLLLAPGSRAALLARMRQTVLQDPEPLLRRIRAPVLLLWGEQDGMIPVRNAADYMRNLADGRLVTFPGLGHVPQEEDPARSLPPVLDFLRGGGVRG